MPSLRFTEVPQPVIPNQQNGEVVFVITRKHFLDYLPFLLILGALVAIPLGAFLAGYSIFINFIRNSDPLTRDILILTFFGYYLILAGIFISSWVSFYFYIFVVTNERIVEIHQRGLFNREFDELDFEQIEDIASATKGFLNTFFNVGNIEIQTAGKVANFDIQRIARPQLAVEIIHSLTHQAQRGVPISDRFPDLETIGSINGHFVTRNGRKPLIMNLDKNLTQSTRKYRQYISAAKTFREKLDRWWWRHNDQMLATFGPSSEESGEQAEGYVASENLIGQATVCNPEDIDCEPENEPQNVPQDSQQNQKTEEAIDDSEPLNNIEEIKDDSSESAAGKEDSKQEE